jgi:hypothetical protein
MSGGLDSGQGQAIAAAAGGNVDNWMRLARVAEDGNNPAEAYGYYAKVLEADAANHEAWFGRGRTAGWTSTLGNFRLPEMVTSFQQSIENAPAEKKREVEKEAASLINSVTIAYYNMARKSLVEYVALDNTWGEYLEQCASMISGLETAHGLDPTNETIIENIIYACRDNVEGIKYSDPYDTYEGIPTTKVRRVSEGYEATLRSIMARYGEKLKALDPNYQLPEIKKASTWCFVVTAAMGDADHPDVVLLRRFRDEVLSQSLAGRAFIRVYWSVGPLIAELIQGSESLRALARLAVVRPAVKYANRYWQNPNLRKSSGRESSCD